jgi:hypothetical protein
MQRSCMMIIITKMQTQYDKQVAVAKKMAKMLQKQYNSLLKSELKLYTEVKEFNDYFASDLNVAVAEVNKALVQLSLAIDDLEMVAANER